MSVKEFELFHGAVLTKLVRNEKPITLRLIETRFDDSRVYTLNDVVELYVKHSVSPRQLRKDDGGYSWTFTFNQEQLNKIREHEKKRPTYLALVCGHKEIKKSRIEICLISPDVRKKIIEPEGVDQHSITVRYKVRTKKFRIMQNRQEMLSIPLNALETWEIPQS